MLEMQMHWAEEHQLVSTKIVFNDVSGTRICQQRRCLKYMPGFICKGAINVNTHWSTHPFSLHRRFPATVLPISPPWNPLFYSPYNFLFLCSRPHPRFFAPFRAGSPAAAPPTSSLPVKNAPPTPSPAAWLRHAPPHPASACQTKLHTVQVLQTPHPPFLLPRLIGVQPHIVSTLQRALPPLVHVRLRPAQLHTPSF
jgi:hypothetical protein